MNKREDTRTNLQAFHIRLTILCVHMSIASGCSGICSFNNREHTVDTYPVVLRECCSSDSISQFRSGGKKLGMCCCAEKAGPESTQSDRQTNNQTDRATDINKNRREEKKIVSDNSGNIVSWKFGTRIEHVASLPASVSIWDNSIRMEPQ